MYLLVVELAAVVYLRLHPVAYLKSTIVPPISQVDVLHDLLRLCLAPVFAVQLLQLLLRSHQWSSLLQSSRARSSATNINVWL